LVGSESLPAEPNISRSRERWEQGAGIDNRELMDEGTDCYISTGDNHWLGLSLAMDSERSITDAITMMKELYGTKVLYWRGLQEAAWVRTMHVRPENFRYATAHKWFKHLVENVETEKIVNRVGKQLGVEVWGVSTLGDWGSPADTPGFNDYPFNCESKLRLDHPEWVPVDKYGYRRQGGTIELAYPDARKALIDLHIDLIKEAGYSGVSFLTYVENFSLRFEDEFGYSAPIVEEFNKRFKIDIRTEPFTKSASREDWYKLRGEYVTLFFQELKIRLSEIGVKLGVFIDSLRPRFPMTWPTLPHTHATIGAMYMDIDKWIQEGIVDRFLAFGNCARYQQVKTVRDLGWLTRGTNIQVGMVTSGPFDPSWNELKGKGYRPVLSLGEDEHYLLRSRIPEQSEAALRTGTLYAKMRFLAQVATGVSVTSSNLILPLLDDQNIILKRLALLALGKLKEKRSVKPIEKALEDEEVGVRSAAIHALSLNAGPDSVQKIFRMIETYPDHPVCEMSRAYLRRMEPFPAEQLIKIAINSRVPEARNTALRVLGQRISHEMLPAFEQGLLDHYPYSRYTAALKLRYLNNIPKAVDMLIRASGEKDEALSNRAALSLGEMVKRTDRAVMQRYQEVVVLLKSLFTTFGTGSRRSDIDWGYRMVGEALLMCGVEGERILQDFVNNNKDVKLSELAWRVLNFKEKAGQNAFNVISDKENAIIFANKPEWIK